VRSGDWTIVGGRCSVSSAEEDNVEEGRSRVFRVASPAVDFPVRGSTPFLLRELTSVPVAIFALSFLLFFSITAQSAVLFDESYIVGQAQEDNETGLQMNYRALLSQEQDPLGLYFVGDYQKDFDSGENRYNYGIEWRLFNEGFYQARRARAKKILESKLESLQLNRDSLARRLILKRLHIHFVENTVLFKRAQDRIGLLEKILKRREKALKAGFVLKEDVEVMRLRLESAKDELEYLKGVRRDGLTEDETTLLNSLEHLKPKPLDALYKNAVDNSPAIKINRAMVKRADFYPSWLDDLDVRLFVVRRNEFYPRDRWVGGVKISVPLYATTKRKRIVELQKLMYMNEGRIIQDKMKKALELRVARLKKAIFEIRRSDRDYRLAQLKLSFAEKRFQNPIQNLKTEPLRELELARLRALDKRYIVLLKRLEAYKYILDILSVYSSSKEWDLFQPQQD